MIDGKIGYILGGNRKLTKKRKFSIKKLKKKFIKKSRKKY